MFMRAGLASIAAALAAALALAACGSDDPATPAAPAAPSSPTSAPAPSLSASADSQAEFCSDLNAFASAAGPTFDIGALALIDGETANERRNVTQLVNAMATFGTLIEPELPETLADDMRVVIRAASEAKTKLADGKPAQEAVGLLTAKEPKAAREAVIAYRGPC